MPMMDDFYDCARGMLPPRRLSRLMQQRMVGAFNHVLQQNDQACLRLAGHAGSCIEMHGPLHDLRVRVLPTGLLETAEDAVPDVQVRLAETTLPAALRGLLAGQRPPLQCDGQAQLADDVQQLWDSVNWDAEDDLARQIGEMPAHVLATAARGVRAGVQRVAEAVTHRSATPRTDGV